MQAAARLRNLKAKKPRLPAGPKDWGATQSERIETAEEASSSDQGRPFELSE